MSDRTSIEWTDASWNPLRARKRSGAVGDPAWRNNLPGGKGGWHCEHVTEACRFCYAEAINRRLGTGLDYKPGQRERLDCYLDEKTLLQPLHWRKPRRIFPCSMTDLFGDWVTDEQLDKIFAVMALTPQHTYQVLTKRPDRMRAYLQACVSKGGRPLIGIATGRGSEMLTAKPGLALDPQSFKPMPLRNVWLLVSICDQKDADAFIPILLDTPAAVRGVSYEPALGPVDFTAVNRAGVVQGRDVLRGSAKLDWVICGGESGSQARPMHPDYARSARDQCAAAGVPFFFKQWGEHAWGELLNDGRPEPWRRWPDGTENWSLIEYSNPPIKLARWRSAKVGKKRAGRLLDGVEHNGFPQSAAREKAA